MDFTHLKDDGQVKMVDVSSKDYSERKAIASGKIYLSKKTIQMIYDDKLKKGNVLTTAQIAGIMAVKKTSELIPLAHNINITSSDIKFTSAPDYIECIAIIKCFGNTGVEMEAIIATNIALATIYDMCKSVDKDMIISDIKLDYKSGGRSGEYVRK